MVLFEAGISVMPATDEILHRGVRRFPPIPGQRRYEL